MTLRLAALVIALTGCAARGNLVNPQCASCPEMVRVPAGSAVFGSAAGVLYQRPDELPRRTVPIPRPFDVSRYEITRAQYDAFVRATNHATPGDCLTDRRKPGDWQYDAGTDYRDPASRRPTTTRSRA